MPDASESLKRGMLLSLLLSIPLVVGCGRSYDYTPPDQASNTPSEESSEAPSAESIDAPNPDGTSEIDIPEPEVPEIDIPEAETPPQTPAPLDDLDSFFGNEDPEAPEESAASEEPTEEDSVDSLFGDLMHGSANPSEEEPPAANAPPVPPAEPEPELPAELLEEPAPPVESPPEPSLPALPLTGPVNEPSAEAPPVEEPMAETPLEEEATQAEEAASIPALPGWMTEEPRSEEPESDSPTVGEPAQAPPDDSLPVPPPVEEASSPLAESPALPAQPKRPTLDINNTRHLAWVLGAKLGLRLLPEAKADPWQSNAVSEMLGVKPSAFETSGSPEQAASQLLKVAGRLGERISKRHGADHAALFEIAIKTNALAALHENHPQLAPAVADAIEKAAGRAELDRKLYAPFVTVLNGQPTPDAVRDAVFAFHSAVEQELLEQ